MERECRTSCVTKAALDPAFQPEDVRLIGDVETLRAISDPTRLRILETMVQRQDPAWSVKELAAEMGVPQTRLYHHVEQLLERDLIRPVERRVVSGIIETRYRVVARSRSSWTGGCSAGDRGAAPRSSTTPSSRCSTRRATRSRPPSGPASSTRAEAAEERRCVLSRGLARLTPARAAELRRRLQAIEAEFGEDVDPDGAAPAASSSPSIPMPRPAEAEAPTSTTRPRRSADPMTDQPAAAPIGVRDLLRIPDFRRLYLAQAISDIGDGMTYLALFLLVLDLTGSTAAIALMSILVALPPVTIGLFAGAWADRHDRRRIMLASDILRASWSSARWCSRPPATPCRCCSSSPASRRSSAPSSPPPAWRCCRASCPPTACWWRTRSAR